MNERIREFAEQAEEVVFSSPSTGRTTKQINLEKFAELILEEVMQQLFINGYEDAFDFLNKHFGVEE